MSNCPKVSVIMPNYNYAQYLNKAIDGVVNQTYKDFEFILIDDGSTDKSLEVIQTYVNKYSFIKLIKHQTNKGVYAAVKTGVDAARGKYCTVIASDDCLLPRFLEKNVSILDNHPDVGLSFSRYTTFCNENPDVLVTSVTQKRFSELKLTPENLIYQIKMYRMHIPGNNYLTRKNLFIEHGGYDPKLYAFTDWFLLLKIGFTHGCYFLPETLSLARIHSDSHSAVESMTRKENAWHYMLSILSHPSNKQLKRAFIRSHVFNTFGHDFFAFVLKRPKYWWFFKQYTYKHFYKRLKAHG